MSLNNFIPTVWSARLLQNLNKELVFAQAGIVNRDYEGEIRAMGDTVKINSIGRVTVGDYSKNTAIGNPAVLNDAQTTLQITQSKFFNFMVDDVDRVQGNASVMDAAMGEAAYAINNIVDQYIAGMHVDAATPNLYGDSTTPKVVGRGGSDVNAYDSMVDVKVLLDEANIPTAGRWIIVPPWFEGLLLKDDRFVKYGTLPQNERLLNGMIGRAAGLNVMTSNNIVNTAGTKYKIMAGHPMAITMALQFAEIVAFRPEQFFSDAVKGLTLYGAKVIRPDALVTYTASKGTL